MKKKEEGKRRRIIISYALAIVLPCLILGFLALRGVKNDQALVERERRNNLLEASRQIINETNEYLLAVENSFAELVDSIAVPAKIIFTDSLLNEFIDRNRAVTGIFYLPASGSPYLLNNNLLYLPEDLTSASAFMRSGGTQDIFENGWQIEYREHDYHKALRYYQCVLPGITHKQTRGEILNAIARIQKKLQLDDEAIKTYDLIWDQYPDVLIQNKILLGAVALLEKSLLFLGKKDTLSAIKAVHLLMTQLKVPAWEMRFSDFTNFLTKAGEIASRCGSSNVKEIKSLVERIYSLQDDISSSLEHTDYLLTFIQSGETIKQNPDASGRRCKTIVNGNSYFFSLFPVNDNKHWGLILNQDTILNNSVYPAILKRTGTSGFYWEVASVNGESLLRSEDILENMPPVSTVFPQELPSWSLTLYPESSDLITNLFQPRASIFLYIFIAIVIILAFGLFFTLQTVNNELNLSKMKSQFMSTVSHEFKSPLTSIRQMSEMLVQGRVPSLQRQNKYHKTILNQSERLSHLIDNILDFSKMEEGQKLFHFEKSDIVPVVRNIVESFQNHTAEQGFNISFTVSEPVPDVVFDREAMEQVVHNLLDNACKYSGDSRKIDVKIVAKGNKVIISVRDFGIGIKREDHDKIFSRFFRAGEELTQTVKGSGIGLTIVKQLVEAHNGEILVDSEIGKGCTFIVTIPLAGP
ncbi:MAG: HAMP domain-containing sensor histidine kinase [Bacteroidota bacterium]|nr:HAMP domain-containing sensor histidine kinase [Bacteroidota bacterium]